MEAVDTPPRTRGGRILRLAQMTTKVAGQYALCRLRAMTRPADEAPSILAAAHREGGRRIAETLGELKGAVMKVGQMASIGTDWLPPELSEPLEALQQEAPPVAYEVIAAQIESELGAPPEALFARFDREPFASASIGQVHRARTDDGREVVVKVQYPGVDKSVGSDLSQLKLALQAAGLLRLSRRAARELFAELRERLAEELDYTNEAANVRLFGQLFADDPEVVVPEVVGERSSQRVLTLSFEPGTPLSELGAEALPRGEADRVGELLARTFFRMVFEHGVFHADPNPANFALRDDGALILYDFGCVKRLPEEVVAGYRKLLRALEDRDPAGIDEALVAIGARSDEPAAVEASFYLALSDVLRPALGRDGVYDFGGSHLGARLAALLSRHRDSVAALRPPVDGVLLNRALVGHHGTLRRLGARLSLARILDPYLRRPGGA